MELKEILKKAIQHEFCCNRCDFVEECMYCNGSENADSFNCTADSFQRGFDIGIKMPIQDACEVIKKDPALWQECLSKLSRHYAVSSLRVGASFLAVRECYKFNGKDYKTTFVVSTFEDNSDNVSEKAEKIAISIVDSYLKDVPEDIKKRVEYLLSVAIVTGYNMYDEFNNEESYDEEDL